MRGRFITLVERLRPALPHYRPTAMPPFRLSVPLHHTTAPPLRRRRSRGQIAGFFALLLPVIMAMLAFTYVIGALYGQQEQDNAAARAAALSALSAVNKGALADATATAAVTQTLLGDGYSSAITTTLSQPNAPASDKIVIVNGVYGASSTGITGQLGTGSLPSKTDAVTVTLTTGVHITWWTLGSPVFTVRGKAVATNTGGVVVVKSL